MLLFSTLWRWMGTTANICWVMSYDWLLYSSHKATLEDLLKYSESFIWTTLIVCLWSFLVFGSHWSPFTFIIWKRSALTFFGIVLCSPFVFYRRKSVKLNDMKVSKSCQIFFFFFHHTKLKETNAFSFGKVPCFPLNVNISSESHDVCYSQFCHITVIFYVVKKTQSCYFAELFDPMLFTH